MYYYDNQGNRRPVRKENYRTYARKPVKEKFMGGLEVGASALMTTVIALFVICVIVCLVYWYKRRNQQRENYTSVPAEFGLGCGCSGNNSYGFKFY